MGIYMNVTSCIEQTLEVTANKTTVDLPFVSNLTNQDELDTLCNIGDLRTNTQTTFSWGLVHIDALVLFD